MDGLFEECPFMTHLLMSAFGSGVAVNDWDMSHGERQFCDIKIIPVTMIVFSKPIVTSQRLVRRANYSVNCCAFLAEVN